MPTLYQVPDNTGSFVGFYKEDDGTLRHLQGWEWNAYLAGGNVPVPISQDWFSALLAAPDVKVSGQLPSGYLGGSIESSWSRKAGTPTPVTAMPGGSPTGGSPAPPTPAAPSAPAAPAPTGPKAATQPIPTYDANTFINELKAQFPWLDQVGLDPKWFQEAAAESSGADELLVKMRQTTAFKSRFAGLYRADGSMRMNEAQYLARESDYRNLLSQYGYDPDQYSTPASLVGFFDAEMDPNEFQSRLQTYADVQRSSQAKKDAFYVYAGINLSDDDLYSAIVDPAAAQRLTNEYNRATAAGKFDYTTWITRATEVGLQRVADVLTNASKNGLVTGAAVQAVLGVDPSFATQIMDAIYTGGSGNAATQNLALEDLLASFEYAAIGAAASESGLTLPTKERLAEIRQAGIERKQAIDAYTAFGQNRERFSAAVQRAGYDEFTQDEFERAQFLGNAGLATQLQEGLAREEAAGKGAGEFRFGEENGRLVQRGFGVR